MVDDGCPNDAMPRPLTVLTMQAPEGDIAFVDETDGGFYMGGSIHPSRPHNPPGAHFTEPSLLCHVAMSLKSRKAGNGNGNHSSASNGAPTNSTPL